MISVRIMHPSHSDELDTADNHPEYLSVEYGGRVSGGWVGVDRKKKEKENAKPCRFSVCCRFNNSKRFFTSRSNLLIVASQFVVPVPNKDGLGINVEVQPLFGDCDATAVSSNPGLSATIPLTAPFTVEISTISLMGSCGAAESAIFW